MRKGKRYLLSVVLLAIGAFGLETMGWESELRAEMIEGNGRVVEQLRTVAPWEKIKIKGSYHVLFTQDDQRSVVVKADENLQELIRTDVRGDELVIESAGPLRSRSTLQVVITNPHVTEVTATAAARFITQNELSAPVLKLVADAAAFIDVKGDFQTLHVSQKAGSIIRLSGKTQTLEARSSAGGTIDAFDLPAASAHVRADAGASADVSAGELNAKASSGATINYSGNPVISNVKADSGGRVGARANR